MRAAIPVPKMLESRYTLYTERAGYSLLCLGKLANFLIFVCALTKMRIPQHLLFVRSRKATYYMLTAYCRITQTGTQVIPMTARQICCSAMLVAKVRLTCGVGLSN